MVNNLLALLKISIIEMIYLMGLIILSGLILGLFERLSNDFMQRSLGRRGIFITAWLGTPIHEIGHAIMCILFKHKITNMKLLNTKSENGTLGYVEHSYDPSDIYQTIGNLFIGIGPIFSGIASLIIAMYLLLPHSFDVFKGYLVYGINNDKMDINLMNSIVSAGSILFKSIFAANNLLNFNFWIFVAIAVCISSHIALSKADIKGAQSGFVTLFTLIFIINVIIRYFSISTTHFIIQLGRYNAHLMAFLIIALIFSAFTLVISMLCYIFFSIRKI
jgi:hypothetical protein